MISLVVLLAMQAADRREPGKSNVTLSVCNVLAHDPTILNGKIIRIKGYVGGTDEGTWLMGDCQTHLVTKGLTWGNDIAWYINLAEEKTARSWERYAKKLKRLRPDWQHDRIWVTVAGRLETRRTMDDPVVQTPYGLARVGFGHLSSSPAEIDVMSIETIDVERNKEP